MSAASAQAADGAIVISCWSNYFSHFDKETLRYTDTLSRWEDNSAGNNLLRKHLLFAQADSLPIRLVVTTAQNTLAINQGWDASKITKTFHIKPDIIGQLTFFDGDQFTIDYRSNKSFEADGHAAAQLKRYAAVIDLLTPRVTLCPALSALVSGSETGEAGKPSREDLFWRCGKRPFLGN